MAETVDAAPVEQVSSSAIEGTNAAVAHAGGASHLSFLDLFWNADIVVKFVILALIAASIWSWTIIFEKWSKFKTAKFKAQRFESNFWAGTSLEQLYEKQRGRANHPMAQVFVAAMDEIQKSGASAAAGAKKGLKERIRTVMEVAKNRALDDMENRLSFLATVGSATPFVGLFGTVWGIMNSFSSIASAKNVSLAVVAPGIAEALFATAIGLVAAIPAVIAYNRFSTDLDKFSNRLNDFSDEFETLISRQLDEGKI